MNLEIEIKFEVKTHKGIILGKDFVQTGTGIERVSFLDLNGMLSTDSKKLRVKEYNNEVAVTVKQKGKSKDGIKSQPEWPLYSKSNFQETLDFFAALGMKKIAYYEKKNRDTYNFKDNVICLDTILENNKPRYFVEVEGLDNDSIIAMSKSMGIYNPALEAKVMKASYFEMFARKRK